MTKIMRWTAALVSVFTIHTTQGGEDYFDYAQALSSNNSGTLALDATIGDITQRFLLDTGAGMVTLSNTLFRSITADKPLAPVRQMAARLANNRHQLINIYRLDSFRVGLCELGPLEVAVFPTGGQNLLGLNALKSAAPIRLSMTPPSLHLGHCHKPKNPAQVALVKPANHPS